MEVLRAPARLEGSEGRLGLRDKGVWSGFEETVDLKWGLVGAEERERVMREREDVWLGILMSLGGLKGSWGGEMKWVGRESVREVKGVVERGCRGWDWSSDWGSGVSCGFASIFVLG
ncbi:hypothetical protein Hanom_Chr11g01021251 [Helianthus anomalus]